MCWLVKTRQVGMVIVQMGCNDILNSLLRPPVIHPVLQKPVVGLASAHLTANVGYSRMVYDQDVLGRDTKFRIAPCKLVSPEVAKSVRIAFRRVSFYFRVQHSEYLRTVRQAQARDVPTSLLKSQDRWREEHHLIVGMSGEYERCTRLPEDCVKLRRVETRLREQDSDEDDQDAEQERDPRLGRDNVYGRLAS